MPFMIIIKKVLLFPLTITKSFIKDVIIKDIKTIKRVAQDIKEERNPMPEENWKALTTGWGHYFRTAGWMYLFIFAAFFVVGYQAAANDLQDACNEFIIEEYSRCSILPEVGKYNTLDGLTINTTFDAYEKG